MKRLLRKIQYVLRRGRADDGFTLIEVVVASAAFTVIVAGLTVLLLTVLRIEKATSVNARRRDSIRIVTQAVKNAASESALSTSDDGKRVQISGEGDSLTPLLTYVENDNCLYVGSTDGEPVMEDLSTGFRFLLENHLLTFTLAFSDGETYEIAIYCPMN